MMPESVDIKSNTVKISLHDLTGFEGRCDAVVLSNEPNFQPPEGETLKTWRRKMAGNDGPPADRGEFDLAVVGGGVAGVLFGNLGRPAGARRGP